METENKENKINLEDASEILTGDLMREEFNEFNYDLPDFDLLCEDFDIEKAFDKDSSYLLREVRKIIMEKLSAYLQLFEMFMNPASPPLFIFKSLRNVDEDDKKMVKDVYTELSKYQLWSVRLDTIYDEEKEADFVKKSFQEWQILKKKIYGFVEKLERATVEKDDDIKGAYLN